MQVDARAEIPLPNLIATNVTGGPNREQLKSPESHISNLGAKKGSERWAIFQGAKRGFKNFINKFASTGEQLDENEERFKTACHELGHARAVRRLGGKVHEISIIPMGRILGFTRYSLDSVRDIVDYVTKRIACAAASRIAEERMGDHDHSGCAGDDGQIQSIAEWGEAQTKGYYSKSWLIANGTSTAHWTMSDYSEEDLGNDAMDLLEEYPVAA